MLQQDTSSGLVALVMVSSLKYFARRFGNIAFSKKSLHFIEIFSSNYLACSILIQTKSFIAITKKF